MKNFKNFLAKLNRERAPAGKYPRGELVIFAPPAYNVFASKIFEADKIKYFFDLTE